MGRNLRPGVERDRGLQRLLAQRPDDTWDLAELGAPARIEAFGCVRDDPPLVAQAFREVACEADRHRARDHHQSLPRAEPLRHIDEMVECRHAVLARRGKVGKAEDERVRGIEVFDPRRSVKRSGARLGDVISDGFEPGTPPQGKLLGADGAETDDSDA